MNEWNAKRSYSPLFSFMQQSFAIIASSRISLLYVSFFFFALPHLTFANCHSLTNWIARSLFYGFFFLLFSFIIIPHSLCLWLHLISINSIYQKHIKYAVVSIRVNWFEWQYNSNKTIKTKCHHINFQLLEMPKALEKQFILICLRFSLPSAIIWRSLKKKNLIYTSHCVTWNLFTSFDYLL